MSLGFRYQVSLPSIDAEKFTKAVQDACRKALLAAAKEFLAAAIPRIPVFTGFARGSLKNLEALTRTTGSISPRTRKPYFYYGTRRTPNNGRQFGTPKEQILSAPSGRATVAQTKTAIHFQFHVDIDYYTHLDNDTWRGHGDWGSFAAGEQAFNAELKEQLALLMPRIGKYTIRREIK